MWGEKNHHEKRYVITLAHYTNEEDKCFNLIDYPKNIRHFNEVVTLLKGWIYIYQQRHWFSHYYVFNKHR